MKTMLPTLACSISMLTPMALGAAPTFFWGGKAARAKAEHR
jgi:hypothetical protein